MTDTLMRIQDVVRVTSVDRKTIYNWIRPGSPTYDPTFPAPVKLGRRVIAWKRSEIEAWMNGLPRANGRET